ncbi:hypothetical protein QOT17_001332 [Balamuthia mandrillaris]
MRLECMRCPSSVPPIGLPLLHSWFALGFEPRHDFSLSKPEQKEAEQKLQPAEAKENEKHQKRQKQGQRNEPNLKKRSRYEASATIQQDGRSSTSARTGNVDPSKGVVSGK